MSGKLQQVREMQLHINFHENLSKMRKAAGINVFNDGEVIVQNAPTSSAEEQENTEEVTVKVSPVKNRAKATRFAGLGKCSRVVLKTNSLDENSDSENDNGADVDVSTFVRPVRKVVTIVPRTTRSTSSLNTASAEKVTKTSSESVKTPCSSHSSEVSGPKVKNFVMDSKMKNFDPAEWRKVKKVTDVHPPEKDREEELEEHLSGSFLQSANSSIINSKCSSRDIFELSSDELETYPLDLSTCDTMHILPSVTATNNRQHQQIQQHLNYPPSQPTDNQNQKEHNEIVPAISSSSSSSISVNFDQLRCNDEEPPSPLTPLPQARKRKNEGINNREEYQERQKRVSFAGNSGPDKRKKEADLEQPQTTITPKVHEEKSVTVSLKGNYYTRLNVLGKGGSSCVYRVMSQNDSQLYAYKRVDVKGSSEDNEAVFDSYINEIELLKRLQGSSPYIIDFVDAEVNKDEMYIAIVMEAGDVDLAKVLTQRQRQAATLPLPSGNQVVQHQSQSTTSKGMKGAVPTLLSSTSSSSSIPGTNASAATSKIICPLSELRTQTGEEKELLNPFFTRMVWQEMLEAVDHIHQHRIVHGDLKPANFVFVRGHLKLIDFGIAKAFSNDTTNIYRESQIGTVNYMAPEAIAPYSVTDGNENGDRSRDQNRDGDGNDDDEDHKGMSMRLGRASDIWSLGCILYQMIYGRPPFAALSTIQKLHAIPNPNYTIQYPKGEGQGYCADWDAIATIQACLQRDPRKRANIRGEGGLLSMPFLSIKAINNRYNNNKIDTFESIGESPNQDGIMVTKKKVQYAVLQTLEKFNGERQGEKTRINKIQEMKIIEEIWLILNREQESQNIVANESIEFSTSKLPLSVSNIKLLPDKEDEIILEISRKHETLAEVKKSKNKDRNDINFTKDSIPGMQLKNSTCSVNISLPEKVVDSLKEKVVENNEQMILENIAGPSQYNRIALLKAAAEVAKRRTPTINISAIISASPSVTITSTNDSKTSAIASPFMPTNRIERKPLRSLDLNHNTHIMANQNQNSGEKNISISKNKQRDGRIQSTVKSPDKQDNRLVIEKRIGAMRKFLNEDPESSVTRTGTVDFMDENSFF